MSDNKQAKHAAPAGPAEPRTIEVRLSRAITVDGQRTNTLIMHEPRLKHYPVLDSLGLIIGSPDPNTGLPRLQLANVGSAIRVAAEQLCGLTEREAAEISMIDAPALLGALLDFFGLSPADLATGSEPFGS